MSEKDVLKVDFFPAKIPFPTFSRTDYLHQTAEDMLSLLQDSPTSPIHQPLAFGPPILNALAKIADILRRAIKPPLPLPVPLQPLPQAPLPVPVQPLPQVPPLTPRLIAASPVTLPRVPLQPATLRPSRLLLSHPALRQAPVTLPRVSLKKTQPLVIKPSPLPQLVRTSPRARLSRLRFDPRTHQQHLVQAMQHDPSVAGKMYNAATGKAENIDSLLCGPDSIIWSKSLTNEWGRCTQGLKKQRDVKDHITGNETLCCSFFHTKSRMTGKSHIRNLCAQCALVNLKKWATGNPQQALPLKLTTPLPMASFTLRSA